MKEVARLLNDLKANGIVVDYALFGAVAQMRYTEPVATLDADVLVVLPNIDTLDVLRPIYEFTTSRGLPSRAEAVVVGRWPVQFIAVFDTLTADAVADAETDIIDGESIRVVSAAYLAAIALSVGRSKDHLRIVSLIEAQAITADQVRALANKYGMTSKWEQFRRKYIDE